MSAKTQGRIANSHLPPSAGFTGEPTCCLWNASIIICTGPGIVNTQNKIFPMYRIVMNCYRFENTGETGESVYCLQDHELEGGEQGP